MSKDMPREGGGLYIGGNTRGLVIGFEATGNAGHGIYVGDGASAEVHGGAARDNGGDGLHFAGTHRELEALVNQMPEEKRGPFLEMIKDSASGAAGGLAAEVLKPMLIAALTAMGLHP